MQRQLFFAGTQYLSSVNVYTLFDKRIHSYISILLTKSNSNFSLHPKILNFTLFVIQRQLVVNIVLVQINL